MKYLKKGLRGIIKIFGAILALLLLIWEEANHQKYLIKTWLNSQS